jgi:hypothetical protein
MTAAVLFIMIFAMVGYGGEKPKEAAGKKPSLEIRQRPLFPQSPADITFTAELKGGTDSEDYYCPTVEWEWGDDSRHGGTTGTKSVEEGDCEPYQPGVSEIVRRFEKQHTFPEWGNYKVQVTLRKGSRVIARQSKVVNVKAGPGDPTAVREPEER